MRIALVCIFVIVSHVLGVAQKFFQQQITHQIDSVLEKAKTTQDDDALMRLLLSIHELKLQAFPTIYLETGQKLNRLAQVSGNLLMESNSWSLMAQGYRLSGNYIKALECHHRAISLAERSGNKALLAIAYNELGHIYKDREENEKALSIYQASLQHGLKSNLPELTSWPKMNMGAIYLSMNLPDSAIYYSQAALDNWVHLKEDASHAYINLNIAGAYSKKGDNSMAMKYFHTALRQAEQDSSARYLNLIYVGLADHYMHNHQVDSSLFFAKQAVAVVQNTPFTFLSIRPARLLTELFENINADSALKYLKIARVANDSLFNSRATQQLQMMTFEEEQRQLDMTLEKREYRNKIKMNFLFGALALFSVAAIILLRNNNQKQRANTILHQQKSALQVALDELKNTQDQLVQSEKMASLGELTAGIAHEIQNPLNFVNNFAEVNAELIDELRSELAMGNTQSAIELGQSVKENEEKIIFHGKRADAIVKGMLQHSRASSGVKEPIDINALVDEYVRLAYHGLRAKDKSFNATIKTDLDTSLGMINVVPQDIGRVVLNLVMNAFYAVSSAPLPPGSSPPLPAEGDNGIPTVTITTKKLLPPSGGKGRDGASGQGVHIAGDPTPGGVEIRITDNGPGIPSHILDKIFQPFFTTKPAGQGTGLGLSLSYDIVKAHGGELKVETKEGEGTEFIIRLPPS